MKKLLALAVMCLSVGAAFADPANSLAPTSAATGTATNAGNAQSITFTAPADTTSTIKNTPSVNGPMLTTSNDTCMGSASGAFNAPGIGIALGKTYTDENCTMLKNSRELWNMGMKAASLALMCNDTNNRSALELTGFECPQTAKAKREAMLASPTVRYTDPIVRARLNLPPL
jgi:hypothetical protein